MPLRDNLAAWRATGGVWPIWIDVDFPTRINSVWVPLGAPDPPTNVLLPAYDVRYINAIGTPDGERFLSLCGQSTAEKLLLQDPAQPAEAETQRTLARGTIVTALAMGRLRLAGFACTERESTEPVFVLGNRFAFILQDTPEWFFNRGLRGLEIRYKVRDPAGDLLEVGHRVRQVTQLPQLLPVETQPRRPTLPPRPIERPEEPFRQRCFDPSTDEEVDCETGEPVDRSPCKEDFIKIPLPEDIIHMRPRPVLPWVSTTDPNTGKIRWNLSRPLSRAEAEEFIRRREITEQIRKSPTPEFARAIAEVMTAIDDTQDALLTVIVFARIFAKRLPPRLQLVLLGGLGVADAMQLVGLGALDLVRVRAIKGRLMKEGSALPFTKQWRTAAARRLARRMPTIGELLQVLQTTDQMFGVGISLGPIMGFIMDLLFGLGKGVQIGYRQPCLDEIRADSIKLLDKWGKLQLGQIPPTRRVPTGVEQVLQLINPTLRINTYEDIMNSVLVSGSPQLPAAPFTQAEFVHQMAAYSVFLDMVEATSAGEDIDALTAAALEQTIRPATQPGTSTSLMIQQGIISEDTLGFLPFPGNPTQINAAEALIHTTQNANQIMLNHFNLDPTSVPAWYMGYLAEEIGIKAVRILDPKHEEPTWIPRDAWRTMDAIYNRGFLPPLNATTTQIQGALSAVLMSSELNTAEPPSFGVMQRILAPLNWTGP